MLFTLPPYFENFGKRLVKSPKLYFYDTGLLCHLLGVRKMDIGPTFSLWGNIFENMVISDLLKKNEHRIGMREYFFWRDSKGHEIDLMYLEGDAFNIYEIKASSNIQSKMFEGMNYFQEISSKRVKEKILIYGGKETQKRTEYRILPWSEAY